MIDEFSWHTVGLFCVCAYFIGGQLESEDSLCKAGCQQSKTRSLQQRCQDVAATTRPTRVVYSVHVQCILYMYSVHIACAVIFVDYIAI